MIMFISFLSKATYSIIEPKTKQNTLERQSTPSFSAPQKTFYWSENRMDSSSQSLGYVGDQYVYTGNTEIVDFVLLHACVCMFVYSKCLYL